MTVTPANIRMIPCLCAAALIVGAGGCMQSASSTWSQNAPPLEPVVHEYTAVEPTTPRAAESGGAPIARRSAAE